MKCVLVVDDHPDNQYYLKVLLQGHGYSVQTAANGSQALQYARQKLPHLVVSDLLMPEMDGYSLLKAWKADPALCAIPFVVYTATYTEPEDEALARRLGADAFVLKPCEPHELLDILQRALHQPATRPAVPLAVPASESAELEIFQQYSQTLVRKLEERSGQLEALNRALEDDITQRTRVEAALRLSEERFRLLAQACSDAAWDLDITQGTRWWSPGFTSVFGYPVPTAQAADQHWIESLHSDDRSRVVAARQNAIRHATAWQQNYRLLRANGSWAYVEDRGHVIADAHGQAVRMVGGITDVTQRVSLEAQLARSQRLESVGQLTGGVAHDFNNLLTVVLGNAQVLVEQAGDRSDLKTLGELILKAADRGATLTRQLLAFASKQVLEPRPVLLNQLVADILSLLQSAVGGGVSISIRAQGQVPPVMVDAAQLESALVNLAVNARDAMQGNGRLEFLVSQVSGESLANAYGRFSAHANYAGIVVSDTGCGIRPDHIDRVFEPFFTTKQGGRGSGLGLAMIFGFVRQSQGIIDVQSSWGHGATFSLFFPLADADAQPAAALPATQARSIPRGNETVLLVDDDDSVRQVLTAHLSSLGYTVLQASNGPDALRALQNPGQSIHLLLTDIMMPGMTGHQLARLAREIKPSLPVLYSTGYQGPASNAPEPVAVDDDMPVLQKPYRRETLAQSVRHALDQR
jgi:PAS domain S-box-containing protein